MNTGALLIVLLSITSIGCHRPDQFTTGSNFVSPITPADISYTELAQRYNQNLEQMDTLWARTDIEMEWYEVKADGGRDYRKEKGEGKIIIRQPGDIALTVEKLGKTYLWAGTNKAQQYWLFDLVDSDNKIAYIGDVETRLSPNARPYPFPVEPGRVPMLLGVEPLTEGLFGSTVDKVAGQYMVEDREQGLRLLIDPETFRPMRIDVLNSDGFSVLTSKLDGAFPVDSPGVRKSRWPSICESAEIYVAGYDSRMTISMDFATNDPRRIRDLMFSFESLNKALKPDKIVPLAGP